MLKFLNNLLNIRTTEQKNCEHLIVSEFYKRMPTIGEISLTGKLPKIPKYHQCIRCLEKREERFGKTVLNTNLEMENFEKDKSFNSIFSDEIKNVLLNIK